MKAHSLSGSVINLYFFGWLLLTVTGLVLLGILSAPVLFLRINHFRTNIADFAFTYITYLGDGFFAVLLAIVFFLFGKKRLALMLIVGYLLSGIFVQVFKRLYPMPRPGLYFINDLQQVFFPDGIILKGRNSFPSGHSTTAFAYTAQIAFYFKKWWIQGLMLLVAVAVAYSRVYLAKHFVADVVTGSFLGVLTAFIIHWFVTEKIGKRKK